MIFFVVHFDQCARVDVICIIIYIYFFRLFICLCVIFYCLSARLELYINSFWWSLFFFLRTQKINSNLFRYKIGHLRQIPSYCVYLIDFQCFTIFDVWDNTQKYVQSKVFQRFKRRIDFHNFNYLWNFVCVIIRSGTLFSIVLHKSPIVYRSSEWSLITIASLM